MCGIAGAIDLAGSGRLRTTILRAWPTPSCTAGRMRTAFSRTGPRLRQSPAQHRRPVRRPAADRQRGRARWPSSSTASCSTIPSCGPTLEARGHVFRTHCDTEMFRTSGKNTARRCSNGCTASSPWPCGTSRQRQRDPGPRPLRHLPALLDPAANGHQRLAAVRLGDQGAARLRHGRARPTCAASTMSSRSSPCRGR